MLRVDIGALERRPAEISGTLQADDTVFEDLVFKLNEPIEGKVVRYFRRPDVDRESLCSECGERFRVHGWIDTPEDGHRVCPGDWIITSVKGERYPCKPDVFEATYEMVTF